MANAVRQRGLLYDQAAEFARRLEARDEAQSLAMLNAWSDSYWGVRREMDQFLAKVAAARAAGEKVSPAWAFQQRRIQTVMNQARIEMARYAEQAAAMVTQRQRQALQEGLGDAASLGSTVVQEGLPGLDVTMDRVNTAVLEKGVGFLADGYVLRNHLAATMPEAAAQSIRDALVQGLARGKSQDWMTRAATRALGLSHGRAVTILRTESLRAYRAASQAVYEANADVMGGWVWNAHLDSRTCVACVLMDGTEHPLDATLDGHPRCRCAMVPRTRSWEDILGPDGADLPDTRPPVRSGKAWLEAQPPTTQRAIIGRAKFTAWQEGHITLDDMVARTHSDAWGTMRTERSLKAITEGRDANWIDQDTVVHPKPDVSEDSLWADLIAQDEARMAARAPTQDWDRWEAGRDVRVRKAADHDRRFAQSDLDYARTNAQRDAAQVADFKALVKERQAELRAYVPDAKERAKERAKVSRTDYTLKSRKESLAAVQKMADQSAEALRVAEARMADLVDNLPDWNPDNPLEFYGDRVTIYDRTDSTAKHLRELSEDVGETHHRLLRDHYAGSEKGGFYIGDRYITDLDDLQGLKGQQPRGWSEGSTFDQVPGVYDAGRRVCACGGDTKGHGSTSLVLHEGGHALDDAYRTQGVGGARQAASERSDYLNAVDAVASDVRRRWNPYFRSDGNPTGHNSEAWAEGFAAWTKVRRGTPEEQARALAIAMTDDRTPDQATVDAHMSLAAYYRSLQ